MAATKTSNSPTSDAKKPNSQTSTDAQKRACTKRRTRQIKKVANFNEAGGKRSII
jgi:hypothetical protein